MRQYLDNVSYINYVSSKLIEELDKIAKYISARYNSKNKIPSLLSEEERIALKIMRYVIFVIEILTNYLYV